MDRWPKVGRPRFSPVYQKPNFDKPRIKKPNSDFTAYSFFPLIENKCAAHRKVLQRLSLAFYYLLFP